MTHRRVSFALGALAGLLAVDAALAVPTGVVLTSPGNDSTPTFAWNANPFVTFEWQLSGALGTRAGVTAAPSAEATPALPDGVYSFIVREIDLFGSLPGDWSAPVTATIDTVPPTISVSSPVAGSVVQAGAVVIAGYTCLGAATCTGSVANGRPIGTARVGPRTFTVLASDLAGNAARADVAWRVIDTVPPSPPPLASPTAGSVFGEGRPTFTWRASTDAQGIDRYEVFIDGTRRATVRAGRRLEWRPPQDLSSGVHSWFVRALDLSGLAADAPPVSFTIDTGAPAPPAIGQRPADPGSNPSPVVTWGGTGPTFTWSLFRSGVAAAIAGPVTGPGTSASLGPLAEGDYTFRLSQTNSFGRRSADVEVPFGVDMTAPGAPALTTRPGGATASGSPLFGWQPAEPAGTFAWEVRAGDGRVIQSARTVSPQVAAGPLVAGQYTFSVRQIDDAGNVGSPSPPDAFAVTAGATVRRSLRARPATLTPRRLRPAPGARLAGKRSILRWSLGPKGTTVYNLQIFSIKPSGKIVKELSVFPRRRQFVLTQHRLKRGERYIWRVWPYLRGSTVAAKPLGVSFFNLVGVPGPGRR